MGLNQMIDLLTGSDIFNLFFKVFSLVFSLLYLIYAIVIYKQTQVMTRTLITERNSLILFVALVQIALGILLILGSILLF